MNNIYVDSEELRECSLDYAGTVNILRELIQKLKVSSEGSSNKNNEKAEMLIKKLEKKTDELENLSLCIRKAADEYSRNEEETAVIIRRKLFVNSLGTGTSLIIERAADPSESSVLFSHLLDHSPMMEEMMIKDAQGELDIK